MNNEKQMSTWAVCRGGGVPQDHGSSCYSLRHQSVDLQGMCFIEMFSPQRGSLSLLQTTRGDDGRSVEFPKDRENQKQILESLRWKRKKKEKKNMVYFLSMGV